TPNVTNGEYTYTASWNVDLDKITGPTTATLNIDYSKLYFGTYPQTKLDETIDATKISELNELAGDLPTSEDTKLWTDYNYIIQGNVSSYMYYQDIDYDNDGDYDYRGVYFTEYRPSYYSYTSSKTYSNQNVNRYSTNTIYWFSFDPIEWDILEASNGKALIIANLILDSQEYYPSSSESSFEHNGGTGYANNYELSNIRKWLNDNFYNTAFNDLQKSIIETTEVDNSGSSVGNSSNKYVCNNTNDKMFLLSIKEAKTYYTSDKARQCKGTYYAKCQGLYVDNENGNSFWWLRSPDSGISSLAHYVYTDGDDYNLNAVYVTSNGIRPACYISL
ncbi:MAG: DUF6273 domain-containing protein, partial [Acholeplasmatales bacterium]|nr:DUF6273 domain-containing protein [Acholeplasmatales bacterium]